MESSPVKTEDEYTKGVLSRLDQNSLVSVTLYHIEESKMLQKRGDGLLGLAFIEFFMILGLLGWILL